VFEEWTGTTRRRLPDEKVLRCPPGQARRVRTARSHPPGRASSASVPNKRLWFPGFWLFALRRSIPAPLPETVPVASSSESTRGNSGRSLNSTRSAMSRAVRKGRAATGAQSCLHDAPPHGSTRQRACRLPFDAPKLPPGCCRPVAATLPLRRRDQLKKPG
jgi:hypothetical protein